jgi:hypothetical protein
MTAKRKGDGISDSNGDRLRRRMEKLDIYVENVEEYNN